MAAVSQQRWLPAAFRRTPPARSGRRRLVGRGMPLTDAIGVRFSPSLPTPPSDFLVVAHYGTVTDVYTFGVDSKWKPVDRISVSHMVVSSVGVVSGCRQLVSSVHAGWCRLVPSRGLR